MIYVGAQLINYVMSDKNYIGVITIFIEKKEIV